MKKKILVADDSALMRRIVCDIINSDDRFEVADMATNGLEVVELLSKKSYDAVILDVVMPQMDGLSVLKELNKRKISAKVIMNSTLTKEGANVTMQALEEGALEFVHKPNGILDVRGENYRQTFLSVLEGVCFQVGRAKSGTSAAVRRTEVSAARTPIVNKPSTVKGKKILAIASSTGGPKALHEVIPKLPANLNAPVLLVQHMPAGFTASLAERLNAISALTVKEAEEGDILRNGCVYIAKGGSHMKIVRKNRDYQITLTNEPTREGVRPCANYMYESLADSDFEEICCVVMTGMGADGTEGIINLQKTKRVHVIAQSEETCAVYGMPRSVVNKGLANEVLPLGELAQAATKNVGGKIVWM